MIFFWLKKCENDDTLSSWKIFNTVFLIILPTLKIMALILI